MVSPRGLAILLIPRPVDPTILSARQQTREAREAHLRDFDSDLTVCPMRSSGTQRVAAGLQGVIHVGFVVIVSPAYPV
jgi:hypothetical protein